MKLNQEQMLATAEQFGIARGWIERGSVAASALRVPYLAGECDSELWLEKIAIQLEANQMQTEENLGRFSLIRKSWIDAPPTQRDWQDRDRDPLPFGRDDES